MTNCSKCGSRHGLAGRYCQWCRAAYMRARRKTQRENLDGALALAVALAKHGEPVANEIVAALRAAGAKQQGSDKTAGRVVASDS